MPSLTPLIGQHRLEELDRDDLHPVVHDRVDAGHADVLDHAQVGEVLLSEGHPEAGAPDRGVVLHERFELFVVDDVRFAFADFRIVQRFVNLVGFGYDPASVLVVAPFLRYFADVDFGVEVGGEGHAVIAGVAVDDVEVVYFVEVMLGGIGREDGRNARIETAAEDGREAFGLETVLIGPLPRILEVRLVLGFVVGRIEVVGAAFEAGVHDREVLIGQGDIHDDVGPEGAEQRT